MLILGEGAGRIWGERLLLASGKRIRVVASLTNATNVEEPCREI